MISAETLQFRFCHETLDGIAVVKNQADSDQQLPVMTFWLLSLLDGDGRTFAEVRTERLGDYADAPADKLDKKAAPEPGESARPLRDTHDLALPSSGRTSGVADACLFGLSLCSGAGNLDLWLAIAIPGYRGVGHVERKALVL